MGKDASHAALMIFVCELYPYLLLMRKIREDFICLLYIQREIMYILCITSPSVNRNFNLAVFRPCLSLDLFCPCF